MDIDKGIKTPAKKIAKSFLEKLLSLSSKVSLRDNLFETVNSIFSFGQQQSYMPTYPAGPNPTPPELTRKHRRLTDPQPFVCEFSNVEILGSPLLPIDSLGRYIIEDTGGSYNTLVDTLIRTTLDGRIPLRWGSDVQHGRPVSSFAGAKSTAFYHWSAEYLPRVRGLEVYCNETGTYPDILIPEDSPDWLCESLRHIGVPEKRMIEWDGERRQALRYVVPSLPRFTDITSPAWGYAPSPSALKWVSNRILASLELSQRNDNRIIITRRGAQTRRLCNEDEVIKALIPYGFEPVVLTDLPYHKQVRLFAHAEAVVAPHGAGLVNTIYSENLRILELIGEHFNPCYYTISGGLNFKYRYELCGVQNGDIVVDTDSLKLSLEKLLSN